MIKEVDDYKLNRVFLDENTMTMFFEFESVTTGGVYIERHKIEGATAKQVVRKMLDLFSRFTPPRMEYTKSFVDLLNNCNIDHNKVVTLSTRIKVSKFTKMEYRTFTPTVKEGHNNDIQKVSITPTLNTAFILTVLHLRANDSLYFTAFNTKTQEQVCLTSYADIQAFVESNKDNTFIMNKSESKQLNAVLLNVDIRWRNWLDLDYDYKFKCITVQELLNKQSSEDIVQKLCYQHMRVQVLFDEANNCLQALENLKYVFENHLRSILSTRQAFSKLNPIDTKLSIISNKLFSNHNAEFVAEAEELDMEKLLDRIPFFVSRGDSGLGGLRGCIENYRNPYNTHIEALDYSSFYPSILLKYKELFSELVNIPQYEQIYTQKFETNNVYIKESSKALINSFIGTLGAKKPEQFVVTNRDAYEFIVKTGHKIMMDTILHILDNNNVKLVHVNTDGAYFEVPNGETFHYDLELPTSHKVYNNIYIKSVNDYMLNVDDSELIFKGTYKTQLCDYVRENLVALIADGEFVHKQYNVTDYIIYDSERKIRGVKVVGSTSLLAIDDVGVDYIEKHSDSVFLDIKYYHDLVKGLLNM